jgi:peptidoglycan/xylan/chitin deacetylase (PgdA/CDA1 family)
MQAPAPAVSPLTRPDFRFRRGSGSRIALWLLLSVCCTTCGLLLALGVCFPQWQMFGHSLCRVHTTTKAVALTFDDGPDPATTPALLDLLARTDAHATFFCVGERVAQQREVVRRMAAEGHLVGNHSYAHNPWTNLFGEPRLRADLEQAQAEIAAVVGQAPVFFRPPMVLTNPRVFRVTRDLALTVVGYTIHGYDRRNPDGQAVLDRIVRQLQPGAIILLHDGGVPKERLLALVEGLLDQLHRQGYRCLRLDDLVACEANP